MKLEYSPAEDPSIGWRKTVRDQRDELADVPTKTLRRRLGAEFPDIYASVRRNTAATLRDRGEDAAADALPETCPYTFDDLIGEWLPLKRDDRTKKGAPERPF